MKTLDNNYLHVHLNMRSCFPIKSNQNPPNGSEGVAFKRYVDMQLTDKQTGCSLIPLNLKQNSRKNSQYCHLLKIQSKQKKNRTEQFQASKYFTACMS